jgi:hypothetical protein
MLTKFVFVTGYVYMNGDIGKLPSGAVYPATPDPLATAASTSTDYRYYIIRLLQEALILLFYEVLSQS